MPYTADTLADFMETTLGSVGVTLFGADPSEHAAIAEAVNEVAAVLDVAVADVDDDLKIRTVARWQAWLTAKGAAVRQYDLTSSGDSIKRSQVWDHIAAMLADAETAAARYDEVAAVIAGAGTAYVTSSVGAGSPYAWPSYPELD